MDFQKELIAEYDRETANTRKILEAIPDDADFAWKPHAKSDGAWPPGSTHQRHDGRLGDAHPHDRPARLDS